MKYMDHDSGFADGQRAVEECSSEETMNLRNKNEFNYVFAVYKEAMNDDIERYKEGANAVEKQVYRSGYLAGVRETLEELAEGSCVGCGKLDREDCECDPENDLVGEAKKK